MAARRRPTARATQASRRNIRRAQMSRRGIREPRSIGRVTRSRLRYSRPATRIVQRRRVRGIL